MFVMKSFKSVFVCLLILCLSGLKNLAFTSMKYFESNALCVCHNESNSFQVIEKEDHLKSECEIKYWKKVKDREGDFSNGHYRYLFTSLVNISDDFYDYKKVLDIGCGPRGSLEWMRKAKQTICVDPLADQYGKLGSASHDMTYLISGAESIPFPSGSFDVVTSINNLDHVSDVAQSIKEIARLVRVDGHFVLAVELHEKPTLCEPRAISPNISFSFEEVGFELVWTKRVEYKNSKCDRTGTGVLANCPVFDEHDKSSRNSFLGLVMKKIL